MEILKEIYSTEGRLNRLRYLKYMIILALAGVTAKFTTTCMGTLLTGDPNGALIMTITVVLAFIAGVGNVMMMIRRLHDLGKSGYFVLIAFIPVIGIIFSIALFCIPGQIGWNEYGADPLEN